MDRHRVDADPNPSFLFEKKLICAKKVTKLPSSQHDADPDPNLSFHCDADPDPDWYENNADQHADPTQSSHMLENRANFFTSIHGNASANANVLEILY